MRQQLTTAMKEAMKAKDQKTLSTVRLILAAIKERDIDARGTDGNEDGINDADILQLLQKMVKQRQDSITAYSEAGRQDLVDQENAEIEIIQRFLPKALNDAEVQNAITAAVTATNASSIKDMGAVMAHLRAEYPGQIDFGKASGLVKQALSSAG